MPTPQQLQLRAKIRRVILTGGVVAITATGAWYGARLKTAMEAKAGTIRGGPASIDEKIAALEERRAGLVARKTGIEMKIAEVRSRIDGKTWEQSKAGRERKRE